MGLIWKYTIEWSDDQKTITTRVYRLGRLVSTKSWKHKDGYKINVNLAESWAYTDLNIVRSNFKAKKDNYKGSQVS
jgi:hypothetical protein